MAMPAYNFYPYTQRNLGLSEMTVARENNMDPDNWATITLANLQVGDTLHFPKGQVHITGANERAITYRFTPSSGGDTITQEATAAHFRDSALFIGVKTLLTQAHPAYRDPICLIIERDPAVYRLQSKAGWVINDNLCAMSGNVSYPLNTDSGQTEKRETPTPEPTTTPAPPSTPEQHGFDF
jgi:hypothetical protein